MRKVDVSLRAVADGVGQDVLHGGTGDTTSSLAATALDGGNGVDLASCATNSAAVSVSLTTGAGAGGEAEGDVLSGIVNLVGSNHGDLV